MAIEILRPADRGAWLAARHFDITASVAAALLGAHPYATPYGLWAEKTGRATPDIEESDAMERGNLMEPVVVEMLRKRHPDWTVLYANDRAYYRDPAKRIGATPDAFLERPDRFGTGICQIKSAAEDAFERHWRDPDTGDVVPPLWIAVQAIVEATLTGAGWACVAVVVLTRRGTFHLQPPIEIPIHPRIWNRIVERVAAFWAVVDSGREPEPDWMRDGPTVLDVYRDSLPDRRDLTADPGIDAMIGRYVEATEAGRMADAAAAALKPQIIRAMGNAEAAETANWILTARTLHRPETVVRASRSRALRVKPKEIADADRF